MKYDPYEELARERAQTGRAGASGGPDDVWRQRAGRFWSWLKRRPAESWGFFVVGLLIGSVIF